MSTPFEPEPQHFEGLAQQLGENGWDLMLVGDGSGTNDSEACGWAVYAYFRPGQRVRRFVGGATSGTNNYAELMTYLHALWAFDLAVTKVKAKRTWKVLVVSDSELTVRCGNGHYIRRANLALWAGIDHFVGSGYQILWRHIPRNSNPISKRCDNLAGKARDAIVSF